jgi:hypothetical protein
MRCGGEMSAASWQPGGADGAVIRGVWERGPGEFIRRVDPEDCRTFLGNQTVRVPAGTVGAVLVDGVVERILPPGEQTSVTLFERIANFFSGRRDRTALYLIDVRPVPVAFAVQTRPTAEGKSIQSQVVVSFSLGRGDKEGIASFVANVLGPKPAFSAQDLHDLLRPEVTRYAGAVLERLASEGPIRYADAESEIRRELTERLGPRYGLSLAVSVAPLVSTASLNICLGTGQAPQLRRCGDCGAELPAAMKFCDRCGGRQKAAVTPSRACSKCGVEVAPGDTFCAGCGHPFTEPSASAAPLFTSDEVAVEVDLVVRVQGQHEDFSPERIAPALMGAAASHLRHVPFARFATADGLSAMEQAVRGTVEQALAGFGLQLVSLSVVDVRSKRGTWLLGAREDLRRAQEDLLLGREWLKQREGEIDLAEVTLAQRLAQQRVTREAKLKELGEALEADRRRAAMQTDDAFARDERALADRQRRDALSGGHGALDVTEAQRAAQRDLGVQAARRAVTDATRLEKQEGELADIGHSMLKEKAAFEHASGLTRGAMEVEAEKRRQQVALDSEQRRRASEDALAAARGQKDVDYDDHSRRAKLEQELKAAEEARQVEKLRAMAELDRQIAAQEHAHERGMREALRGLSEREMIAAQATELAKTEGGGAAWAQALAGDEARRLGAEHANRIEEVMRRQLDRMENMTTAALDSAAQRDRGAAGVYEKSMDAMSRVAASKAAPAPVVAAAVAGSGARCKNPDCGAALRSDATFCGACGQQQ